MSLTLINTIDISGVTGSGVGVTFDGKYFWLVGAETLWQVDCAGREIKELDISDDIALAHCITFDGKYFWIASGSAKVGEFLVQVNKEGNELSRFDSPDSEAVLGVAFDGKDLWTGTDAGTEIRRWSKDGTLINSFSTAAWDVAENMTFDGKYLWHTNSPNIYQVTRQGAMVQTFDASSVGLGTINGITFDGKYLWILDVTNDNLCQLART